MRGTTGTRSIFGRNGEFHFAALSQAQLQAAAASVGQNRSLGIDAFEHRAQNAPQLRRIIDPRHQVHHDLLGYHFQDAAGLGQLPELVVIVPIIIVGLLKGLQRLVKNVACDYAQAVHQTFLLRIQPDHLLFNQTFQARLGLLRFLGLAFQLRQLAAELLDLLLPR